MKSKSVAASLAFLLGIFGVHRFYLGRRFQGMMHMALFFFTFIMTVEEGAPFIMIPALLGFIDAVLLFVMPVEEFDEKYNRRALQAWRRAKNRERRRPRETFHGNYSDDRYRHSAHRKPYSQKRLGIELFRAYEFDAAVQAFEKALDEDPEDSATHFNLACTHGMLEDADRSFYHLEKAVEYGFQNLEKIHRHDALSYLRSLPEFDEFVDNGYALPDYLYAQPEEEERETLDLNGQPPQGKKGDLLDQIIKLGDLRDKGILTEQEFIQQKKKLLG